MTEFLTGREEDVERAMDALAVGSCVLLGVPGVGCTAVLGEVEARLVARRATVTRLRAPDPVPTSTSTSTSTSIVVVDDLWQQPPGTAAAVADLLAGGAHLVTTAHHPIPMRWPAGVRPTTWTVLEVPPLSVHATAALVRRYLGDDSPASASADVWSWTGGHAAGVVELCRSLASRSDRDVASAIADDLTLRHGVLARLGLEHHQELLALALLAVFDQAPVAALAAAVGRTTIVQLDRRCLVEVDADGLVSARIRLVAGCARAAVSTVELRELETAVAAAMVEMEEPPTVRARAVAHLIAAGSEVELPLLEAVVDDGLDRRELEAVDLMASELLERDPDSLSAALAKAQALAAAGQTAEAEQMFEAALEAATDDDDRTRVAVFWLQAMFDHDEDLEHVRELSGRLSREPASTALQGEALRVRLFTEPLDPVLRAAEQLLDSDLPVEQRPPLHLVAATAATHTGQHGRARSHLRAAAGAGAGVVSELDSIRTEITTVWDHLWHAELPVAGRIADEMVDRARAAVSPHDMVVAASAKMMWASFVGRAAEAERWAEESLSVTRGTDARGQAVLLYALPLLAEMNPTSPSLDRLLEISDGLGPAERYVPAPGIEIAAAIVAEASGERRHDVAARLLRAAGRAAERDARTFEAVALHALDQRVAGAGAERLAAIAEASDGAFQRWWARAARARASQRGGDLDRLALETAASGALRLAFHLALDASAAHRATGHAVAALRSWCAAASMADGWPDGRPPTLAALLSARERAVVAGVAGGGTSRQIADRLSLSPRTVESMLHRLYRRMDVDREALLQAHRDGQAFARSVAGLG